MDSIPQPPRRPAARRASRPAEVERWLTLTRQLGDAIVAAGADCGRVTAVVKEFSRGYATEMFELNTSLDVWEAEAGPRAARALYAEARPHINHRVDAAIRCDKLPASRRAFDAYLKASGLDTR